jgi:hypothetical protein
VAATGAASVPWEEAQRETRALLGDDGERAVRRLADGYWAERFSG